MGVRSTNTTQSFGSDFYRSGIEAADPYVPPPPLYVDDVFSTYVETATTDQPLNIDNGIDQVNINILDKANEYQQFFKEVCKSIFCFMFSF